MERSSRPSRRKQELEPISVEEALADSALTGMLSFLERKPMGDPLPWAIPALPELATPLKDHSVVVARDTSTVGESPTVEVSRWNINGTSTVKETSTVEASQEENICQPEIKLAEASTVEVSFTVEGTSTVEAPSLSPVGAKSVTARLMRATLVQHGHTPAEQILYTTLWANGIPDSTVPNTRLVRLGYRELTRLCNFSKRTLTSLIPMLVQKLAIEIVDGGAYDHTARCYRVWDMKALLIRREGAGMRWVLRNKGVRFVPDPADRTVATLGSENPFSVEGCSPVHDPDSGRICTSTMEEPAPVTVEDPATQLRKGRTDIKKTSSFLPNELAEGLQQILGFTIDQDAVQMLWNRCRNHVTDCTVEEMLHFANTKAALFQNRKIRNPIGFLLAILPKCFAGSPITEYRAEKARMQEQEAQTSQEAEEQVFQIRSEFEAMLLHPDTSEEDRRLAQRMLDQLTFS